MDLYVKQTNCEKTKLLLYYLSQKFEKQKLDTVLTIYESNKRRMFSFRNNEESVQLFSAGHLNISNLKTYNSLYQIGVYELRVQNRSFYEYTLFEEDLFISHFMTLC